MPFLPSVVTGSVEVDSLPVNYYDSRTTSELTALVLVHGTGGSAESHFWALFPMLASTRRVIALDLADGDEPASIERYLKQIRAVLIETVRDEPVVLVGYSLGAVVGASFAAAYPALLSALVLVAGWSKTDQQQRIRNDVWRTLRNENSSAMNSFRVLVNYSARYVATRTQSELDEILGQGVLTPQRDKQMELNRSIDITDALAQVSQPTLIVGCTYDLVSPIGHSQLLFGGIANSRFAEIPSGHAVVHERPAELFAYIDEFANDPSAYPAGAHLAHSRP